MPELYASVAGLHPHDIPGWHYSSFADYYGPSKENDYGTPGFAYTLNTKYENSNSSRLFGGLHTNEGYDPVVSGDPGYGITFAKNNEVQIVLNLEINPGDPYQAKAEMVTHVSFNPEVKQDHWGAFQIICIFAYEASEKPGYTLITHEQARELIKEKIASGWKHKTLDYQSNPNAKVENLALPPIVTGITALNKKYQPPTGSPLPKIITRGNPSRFSYPIKNKSVLVKIMDLKGKTVVKNILCPASFIDLSSLQSGVYLIHIANKESFSGLKMIVID